MRRLMAVAASAAALAGTIALVAPAQAEHSGTNACNGPAYGATTPAGRVNVAPPLGIVTVGTGGNTTTFYIDDRNYLNSGGHGLWIYQETNSQSGLQRKFGQFAETDKVLSPALGPNSEVCNNGYTGVPDKLYF